MAINEPFLLEDRDAFAVLGAYYPPRDGVSKDERVPAAIAKRRELHPEESEADARAEVERLVALDKNEQGVLVGYAKLIERDLALMKGAIDGIKGMSANATEAKNNWFPIWQCIEGALNRAAAISRIFDAGTQGEERKVQIPYRKYRKQLLRLIFGIKDGTTFAETARAVRNMLEHFEDHLDMELHDAADQGFEILDLQCFNVDEAAGALNRASVLRWYDYETQSIYVLGDEIKLHGLMVMWRELAMAVRISIYLRGRYHPQFWLAVRDLLAQPQNG
jgi:hypothetical protein